MTVLQSGRLGNPFGYSSDPRFLFLDGVRRNTLAELVSAIAEGAKALLVVGPPEIGKTSFLASLVVALGRCRDVRLLCVDRVFSCHSQTTFADIVHACEMPRMVDRAAAVHAEPSPCRGDDLAATGPERSANVLVLDDADALSDTVLADLWSWCAEVRATGRVMNLVLSGAPATGHEEELGRVDLAGVVDRTYSLQPFPRPQIEAFIRHRQHTAGDTGPDLFTAAGIDRIAFYSRGYPGRIARLCAHALVFSPPSERPIDGIHVKKAAWDLFLPEAVKDRLRELHLVPFLAQSKPPPEARRPAKAATASPAAKPVPPRDIGENRRPAESGRFPPAQVADGTPPPEPTHRRRARPFQDLRPRVAAVAAPLRTTAVALRGRSATAVESLRRSIAATVGSFAAVAQRSRGSGAGHLGAAVVALVVAAGMVAWIDGEGGQAPAISDRGADSTEAAAPQAMTEPEEAAANWITASPADTPDRPAEKSELTTAAPVGEPQPADPAAASLRGRMTAAATTPDSDERSEAPVRGDADPSEPAANDGTTAIAAGATATADPTPAKPPRHLVRGPRTEDPPATSSAPAPAPRATAIPDQARVRVAQTLLARLGYVPGPADGILGERTRAAVLRYQRDRGLPANGNVGEPLIARLRSEVLAKANAQRTSAEAAPTLRGWLAKLFVFSLDSIADPEGFRSYCHDNRDNWIFDKGSGQLVFCERVAANNRG